MNTTRVRAARAAAEAYMGRPVDDAYLLGTATGGMTWLQVADAVLAEVGQTTDTPVKGTVRYKVPYDGSLRGAMNWPGS